MVTTIEYNNEWMRMREASYRMHAYKYWLYYKYYKFLILYSIIHCHILLLQYITVPWIVNSPYSGTLYIEILNTLHIYRLQHILAMNISSSAVKLMLLQQLMWHWWLLWWVCLYANLLCNQWVWQYTWFIVNVVVDLTQRWNNKYVFCDVHSYAILTTLYPNVSCG